MNPPPFNSLDNFPPMGDSIPPRPGGSHGEKRSPPLSPGESPDHKIPRTDQPFSIPDHPLIKSPSIEDFHLSIKNIKDFTVDKKSFPLFLSYVTHSLAIAAAILERQDDRLKSQTVEIDSLNKKLASHGSEISLAKSSSKDYDSKLLAVSNSISSLKSNEQNRKIVNDLDLCNRSIKISNFPAKLITNCDNPKAKIREHLESLGADSKNSLHDTSITILCNLKTNKNPNCPVLISCKNSTSKSDLSRALQKENPSLNLSFHFPSTIHKQVKQIRDKLSNNPFCIEDKQFDLRNSWIMVRPTADSSRLKVFYKSNNNHSNWSFLTLIPIPPVNTDNLKDFNWGKITWPQNNRV